MTNIHEPGEPKQYQQLAKALLPWYQKHGRKHLPWQMDKDPYRVWLSEIMLQQTQVKTVIPYFNRFIEQFPNLVSLAQACEEKVLQLWAGLGYYSRALRLHNAAKIIVEKHGGVFPRIFEEVLALPGIGRSTAGAICSLSFDQATPLLDGNAKRVLCRYYGIQKPAEASQTLQLLWKYAQKSMPTMHCGNYSQAIMDLGATLCSKIPNCAACPLKKGCYAKQHGLTNILPLKKPSKMLPRKVATFLILRKQDAILIKKRPKGGIWGGLWFLPELEGLPCIKTLQNFCLQNFALPPTDMTFLPTFKHTFTHYHLTLHPVLLMVKQKISLQKPYQWYPLYTGSRDQVAGLRTGSRDQVAGRSTESCAFPRPMQKIINQL